MSLGSEDGWIPHSWLDSVEIPSPAGQWSAMMWLTGLGRVLGVDHDLRFITSATPLVADVHLQSQTVLLREHLHAGP